MGYEFLVNESASQIFRWKQITFLFEWVSGIFGYYSNS